MPSGSWIGADGDHWFRVRPEENSWQVESNSAGAFERLFRLDLDEAALQEELVRRGPELKPIIGTTPGLRLMRPADAEETFFTFLCTPNNHVARIGGMVRALASYGPILTTVEGVDIHRFPSAERIAEITESELRDRKFGYRARTIGVAARFLLDQPAGWLLGLREQPYEVAFDALLSVPGVGPKLADCIALFALHHTRAVPIDTHIWQQVVRHYRPDWSSVQLTARRYREAGDLVRERFGDLSGWAQQVFFYDNLLNWRSRR